MRLFYIFVFLLTGTVLTLFQNCAPQSSQLTQLSSADDVQVDTPYHRTELTDYDFLKSEFTSSSLAISSAEISQQLINKINICSEMALADRDVCWLEFIDDYYQALAESGYLIIEHDSCRIAYSKSSTPENREVVFDITCRADTSSAELNLRNYVLDVGECLMQNLSDSAFPDHSFLRLKKGSLYHHLRKAVTYDTAGIKSMRLGVSDRTGEVLIDSCQRQRPYKSLGALPQTISFN